MRLMDVYANLLLGFTHEPTLHANYGSKMVSVRDGLPKFQDLPAELGGSGEVWPISVIGSLRTGRSCLAMSRWSELDGTFIVLSR